MSSHPFFNQLTKSYAEVLRNHIEGRDFVPIVLRGGKNKPATTVELHEAIRIFQQGEKNEQQPGWVIEWEEWSSKKLGYQSWPRAIRVPTLTDFLFLLKKEKEFTAFSEEVSALNRWRPAITSWLAQRPDYVLRFRGSWQRIAAVVDYFLKEHIPDKYYLRSVPVPVHTKFIELHEAVIVSLLQHLAPERFPQEQKRLEQLAALKPKPVLFTLRWLDQLYGKSKGFSMELLALSPETLRDMNWDLQELWLVENETALYMLPERKQALAIYTRGKAIELLAAIPFFERTRMYYWGDMDEDGYYMLSQCRRMYPQCISRFMSVAHILDHEAQRTDQPDRYRH